MTPGPVDGSDHDALLTAADAAAFLQVNVSWIYEHVRPGASDRLPAIKVGKYLRFDPRDLRAYVDAKRESRTLAPHAARRPVEWPPG